MTEEIKPMPSLSTSQLMEMDPQLIAKAFNVHYTGDLNPFDHGGIFYRSDSWQRYGYAETIGFVAGDSTTYVESGTINCHPKFERNMRSAFSHLDKGTLDELMTDLDFQIQETFAHWGHEPEVLGTYTEEDSGEPGEEQAWGHILRQLFAWKNEELANHAWSQ